MLQEHRPSCGTLVVGTKNDLGHLREVEEVDGRSLALGHSCRFTELSSAEDYTSVLSTFDTFLKEIKSLCPLVNSYSKSSSSLIGPTYAGGNTSPKQKKMLVTRMLGSLIGRASPPPTPITQLIVLDRNEFAKSKSPIRHL